jgi:hypothetical protein
MITVAVSVFDTDDDIMWPCANLAEAAVLLKAIAPPRWRRWLSAYGHFKYNGGQCAGCMLISSVKRAGIELESVIDVPQGS